MICRLHLLCLIMLKDLLLIRREKFEAAFIEQCCYIVNML